MKMTTLCYIEKDGKYLMLHRTKKQHDINKDKWIGVGGHAEGTEGPEDCLLREVKEERGSRIFPITDKSTDVLNCFINRLKELKVKIYLNENVEQIITQKTEEEQKVIGIKTNKRKIEADKVILATGGKSYPLTGSTGEGYKMAKELGHTITEIKPSLVPLETYEVEKELKEYYVEKEKNNEVNHNELECDLVSTRIVELLQKDNFELSVDYLKYVHKYLFQDVYEFAGEFRKVDFSKHERILNNDSVAYGDHKLLGQSLDYDIILEKNKNYKEMNIVDVINNITDFSSRI